MRPGTDKYEKEMMDELNRRYGGRDAEKEWESRRSRSRIVLKLLALFVFLLFLAAIAGRWTQVFTWLSFDHLRESAALSGDPLISSLQEAVVLVEVQNVSGAATRQSRGTGFNISPEGLIVTNRHLVENAVSIAITFQGRRTIPASIWNWSSESDLALVELKGDDLPSVSLANHPPSVGEEVIIIGNPRQFTRLIMKGTTTGHLSLSDTSVSTVMIDAPIHPGNSGSPVFNKDGFVTAVVYALARDGGSPALAVPVTRLHRFLADTGR